MGKEGRKKQLQKELCEIFGKYGSTLTRMEEGELRSWTGEGNSPYRNPENIAHPGGRPYDFIEWYRCTGCLSYRESNREPVREEQFQYYTNRRYVPETVEGIRKYLREVQTFLGNEVVFMEDFLKKKGLLEEYMRTRYPAGYASFDEIPFL